MGISYTCKKTLCYIEMGLRILNIDGLVQERHNSSALAMKLHLSCINSLWPSDAIWQQRSGSTLTQVMACCLTAPSHYLNSCWQIISEVQWHSHKRNFTRNVSTINHYNPFENYISKISFKFPRGQWVNPSPCGTRFIMVCYWSLIITLLGLHHCLWGNDMLALLQGK